MKRERKCVYIYIYDIHSGNEIDSRTRETGDKERDRETRIEREREG